MAGKRSTYTRIRNPVEEEALGPRIIIKENMLSAIWMILKGMT